MAAGIISAPIRPPIAGWCTASSFSQRSRRRSVHLSPSLLGSLHFYTCYPWWHELTRYSESRTIEFSLTAAARPRTQVGTARPLCMRCVREGRHIGARGLRAECAQRRRGRPAVRPSARVCPALPQLRAHPHSAACREGPAVSALAEIVTIHLELLAASRRRRPPATPMRLHRLLRRRRRRRRGHCCCERGR